MLSRREIRAFVNDFGDVLSDPHQLPFDCRPVYEVEKPDVMRIELDCPSSKFCFSSNGIRFGNLTVIPKYEENQLYINSICTCHFKARGLVAAKNVGRELVRRTVKFAYERNIQIIETSTFRPGAASFWLGLGFRSVRYVNANWLSATRAPKDEVEIWKRRLQDSPEAVWDLAQTEVGRRVLYKHTGRGVVDFADDRQRNYVFNRINLTYGPSGRSLVSSLG